MPSLRLALLIALVVLLPGCVASFGPNAVNGIVFYSPGAGNLELADEGVRRGLERAGFKGQIATVMWTFSFNPAIDQALRINARLGASQLARSIEEYIDRYPGKPVNLIGLSAGTGVTIWALENLKPGYQVDSVVLLSSSLSYDYDVSQAFKAVKGKVYNYYSSNDVVLAIPMKVFGTIDGKFNHDGAGAVGLRPRGPARERVVNLQWKAEYSRYGYNGGHMDATAPEFVRTVIARHVVTAPVAEPGRATDPVAALRDARPD